MAASSAGRGANPTDPESTDVGRLSKTQANLRARQNGQPKSAASEAEFQEFYEFYDPIARRYLGTCGLSETEQEDCWQEVWRKVVEDLPKLEYDPNRGKFRSWLNAVVYHTAIDIVRRRTRDRVEPLSALVGAGQEPCSSDEGPEARFEHCCNQEIMQIGLAEMRQETFGNSFDAFCMLVIEQRPVAEVAQKFGMQPQDVYSLHWRFKEKLKAILIRRFGPDVADLL